jgi:hypothetical protein
MATGEAVLPLRSRPQNHYGALGEVCDVNRAAAVATRRSTTTGLSAAP